MATEKSITTVSEISNPSANNLSSYDFTMSNSSGTPSRLPGSVFANVVLGSSSGYTIWTGTKAQYNAISSKSSTTLYFTTD